MLDSTLTDILHETVGSVLPALTLAATGVVTFFVARLKAKQVEHGVQLTRLEGAGMDVADVAKRIDDRHLVITEGAKVALAHTNHTLMQVRSNQLKVLKWKRDMETEHQHIDARLERLEAQMTGSVRHGAR